MQSHGLWRHVVALSALSLAAAVHAAQPAAGKPDRTVLPIAEPKRPVIKEIDARKVKAPPRFEVKAPKGAPNVVIVLIDDMGFGVPSSFGGPVPMPTLDKLAQSGLRYNNFHTTALCSPTRAALKSGRNHHTLNMGFITEMATGMPGNTGQIPDSTAPLAEMLRLNGYSTAAFGKWHETASWEISVSGPFDRWPTRQGFETTEPVVEETRASSAPKGGAAKPRRFKSGYKPGGNRSGRKSSAPAGQKREEGRSSSPQRPKAKAQRPRATNR